MLDEKKIKKSFIFFSFFLLKCGTSRLVIKKKKKKIVGGVDMEGESVFFKDTWG
jgi:hypothetical protein